MKTIHFSVNTPAILKEVYEAFNGKAPGICEAMNLIRVGLARIAQRAIETGDTVILEELETLGCVHERDGGK